MDSLGLLAHLDDSKSPTQAWEKDTEDDDTTQLDTMETATSGKQNQCQYLQVVDCGQLMKEQGNTVDGRVARHSIRRSDILER